MITKKIVKTSWKVGQRGLAVVILGILSPIIAGIGVCLWLEDKQKVIFRQKRWGKDKQEFTIYKFRTMRNGAEREQEKLSKQNEADGPVFKIWNDPRHTKVGRWLSHTGLDELPQLVNVIRGEMVLVGPRPLPVKEARRVPTKYHDRFKVLPGLTSLWIVNGAHNLSFIEWMNLDLQDVERQGIRHDLLIIGKTIWMIGKGLIKKGKK